MGSIESSERYSQAEELEKLAGEYEPLGADTAPIDFIKQSDGTVQPSSLVRALIEIYKKKNSPDPRGAAIAFAARMARSGVGTPGFDVNFFVAGSKIEFLNGDEVRLTYYPRGESSPFRAVLDLAQGEHEFVDKSRQALEGTRLEMFEEALDRHNLYNVSSILGYNWGDRADKQAFLGAVVGLTGIEYDRSGDKNSAICRKILELINERDAETIFNILRKGAVEVEEAEEVESRGTEPAVEKPAEILAEPAAEEPEVFDPSNELTDENIDALSPRNYEAYLEYLWEQEVERARNLVATRFGENAEVIAENAPEQSDEKFNKRLIIRYVNPDDLKEGRDGEHVIHVSSLEPDKRIHRFDGTLGELSIVGEGVSGRRRRSNTFNHIWQAVTAACDDIEKDLILSAR